MSDLANLIKVWRSGDYSVACALWDCLQEEGMPWVLNPSKDAFPFVIWSIEVSEGKYRYWFAEICQEVWGDRKQAPYVRIYNKHLGLSYPLAGDESESNLKERANLAIYSHLVKWAKEYEIWQGQKASGNTMANTDSVEAYLETVRRGGKNKCT